MADIEHKSRTKDNPENWTYHGINTDGFKGMSEKQPTDRPPEDLNQADLPANQPRLPPQIIEHDDKGNTTDKHMGNDERYSNAQLNNIHDDALDKNTPTSINSETSQDPAMQKAAEEKRNPSQPNTDNVQQRTVVERVAVPTQTSTTDANRGTVNNGPDAVIAPNTSAGQNAKPVDPNLTVR